MEFIVNGGKVGLSISKANIAIMLKHISKSGRNETGGILIGYYTNDQTQAVVCTVTGPPRDSLSGSHWFKRGIYGLRSLLNRAWKRKLYYLGEWHFHPMTPVAEPSNQDLSQMKEIAFSQSYNCPEPIMVIIAGNLKDYIVVPFLTVRQTGTTTRMMIARE